MISELILLANDEVASIATEDEDALLASDSEDQTTVVDFKKNGTSEKVVELEDGEIDECGVNEVNEDDDSNICRFVVADRNAIQKLELTHESIKTLTNSSNHSINGINLNNDMFTRVRENWSSTADNNAFKRDMVKNYLKSMPAQKNRRLPYNMSEIRSRRTIKEELTFNMMNDIERPSSPALSLNRLLENFKSIHVSESQNTSDKYLSKVLSKPTLKLPPTTTDGHIFNQSEGNNSDDDVRVIAVVPAAESCLNGKTKTVHSLLSDNDNKVQTTCAELDKLQISGMPKPKSENIFMKPKPNLLASISKKKHSHSLKFVTDIQTQSQKLKVKLRQYMLSQGGYLPVLRSTSVPRVCSDQVVGDDEVEWTYPEINLDQTSYEIALKTLKHLAHGRRRIFENEYNNSLRRSCPFPMEPSITDPLLQSRVKIVFGGIFTVLDKHRFHDLCRDNDRYVQDYRVNVLKSQGVVLCRSSNSAIKFISQRPIEHVRKYKVIKVEEVPHSSYDFYADSD